MSSSRADLCRHLTRLGVRNGDTLMVHASLKSIGPVEGGPDAILEALLDSIGPAGNLMAYVSWDRSPYEETLDGARMDPAEKDAWPAFDPRDAGTYRGFGVLNEFIVKHPKAHRSANPDASMAAIGPGAARLVNPHPLGSAYGRGSPLERFLEFDGSVLMLGAPLDAVTLLHYAEAIADTPGKRMVSYEMPLLDSLGRKSWQACTDYDSNGILDCFAVPGEPDAVERIARDFVKERPHLKGRVGEAECFLLNGRALVDYGVNWLETRFGAKGHGA